MAPPAAGPAPAAAPGPGMAWPQLQSSSQMFAGSVPVPEVGLPLVGPPAAPPLVLVAPPAGGDEWAPRQVAPARLALAKVSVPKPGDPWELLLSMTSGLLLLGIVATHLLRERQGLPERLAPRWAGMPAAGPVRSGSRLTGWAGRRRPNQRLGAAAEHLGRRRPARKARREQARADRGSSRRFRVLGAPARLVGRRLTRRRAR
ncbi:MAG TPA: hypothetical protein VG452_03140 [Egibacteraceae bacterium]|nr:hypothetical protein [Egibacteraceae bacterium]